MLIVEDLHVYYGEIHALKGVSLTVGRGQLVALIGASFTARRNRRVAP